MRVPVGWKMIRVGDLRLRQIVWPEKAKDGGREVVGEESSTAVPETIRGGFGIKERSYGRMWRFHR